MTLPPLPTIAAAPTPTLGGRSSHAASVKLPAVQQNAHQALIGLLQPSVPNLTSALQGLTHGAHSTLEAIGVGSTGDALPVLIGLLHNQGLQVKEAFGGGLTGGYSGPSVVFRTTDGTPVGVFVRQVGLARSGAL